MLMKAVVYYDHGSPDVLRYEDIEKPVVGDDEGKKIGTILARMLQARVWSPFLRQKFVFFMAKRNQEDLAVLRDLLEAGKVTPVLDRTYRLSDAADALRYLEEGHARGKVVITV
jgi:NADPH:quinone reductase-like Zn-dependent oxidoreductase